MNILIADDESVIREGVRRTIKKACPDYHIYLAASTEEAVKMMSEQPIDIVLTDILMPGMNGLEFMRISKRKYPHVRWVVISAHSEFSYAQEAVRLGARDYLLKPLGKNKVIELIHMLKEEIDQETEHSKDSKLLKTSLKYLREAVFQRLASGLDIGNIDIKPFVQDYPEFYLVMIQMEPEDKSIHLDHFIVENVLGELIDTYGKGFVVSYDRKSLLGLVKLDKGYPIMVLQEKLKEHLRHYMKVPFQIVNSGLIHDFASVPKVVTQMRHASAAQDYEYFKGTAETPIEVALQYIKTHYNEDLSLEKVASVVFLNPVYFSQLFKAKMGQGYKEYVTSLRLEQARQLLLNPKLRLAEIADRIGYQDVRHFTQVFRKKFMLTPTEYRLQQNVIVISD
ncbi:response regulator [Paenibacillus sediminis]|uniref:Two-component system response regulator YesN n=1 Tax=Paenibacillus sediminis TaxID=664909 RepID=A0ABS4H1X5_9BACL|nr:response regulator [Paenibacillus sediminis]MBP1936115.1 two-component system response regulator YesN [Paenibacillus sediminis]